MTLKEIIQREYPDAEADQYEILQDGTELKIERWEVRNNGAFTKQPTEEQLRMWIDGVEQAQIAEAKREQSLRRVASLMVRGLVGRPLAQLSDAELHQINKALLIVLGVTDSRGTVLPTDQWIVSLEQEVAL